MTAIITVSSNAISIAGNTAGQPVYTYARINQVPPPPGKQEDKKADVLGAVGSVVSQAGIFNSGGRFAQATSQVTTLATGATLSVITRVSGIGVTATGVAQKGFNYASRSPVEFVLELEELVLRGRQTMVNFRLEQPQNGDHLRELSDDLAPSHSLPVDRFTRSSHHHSLFVLSISLGADPHRPGVFQVHSVHDRKMVKVDHEISARDFEFDLHKGYARYIGYLNADGQRVTSLQLSIDPGKTSKTNNLIAAMWVEDAIKRSPRQPKVSEVG